MKIEEGAILYCMRDGAIPTQCKVHYINFGGDGTHLLTYLPDNQAFIANDIDLAETAEACEENYKKRIAEEYNMYYSTFGSNESLILHLFEASINGRKIEGIELKAVSDRISEFTQIDIAEYLQRIQQTSNQKGGCL